MAVYVDDMYKYPMGRFGRMKMSHMVADNLDELLEMADTIGVQRKWLQKPGMGRGHVHFDISIAKRDLAILHGAIELTLRDLSAMCREWNKLNVERAKLGIALL